MTDERIHRLMNPRSIAIIGASDRSRWSTTLEQNLRTSGFAGQLLLVNAKGGVVHGRQAHASIACLNEPVDLGLVLVPARAVPEVLRDLGQAGTRAAMILTSGFGETGNEGARLETKIHSIAKDLNIALLGPNSLGFANFSGNVLAWATPLARSQNRSGVGIISQSGATALFLTQLAEEQGIDLSCVVSTGNETDLDATAFLEYQIADPDTCCVALFLETIRNPERFLGAIRQAHDQRKPVVVLKVGASEVTAKSAQAHTGALVGDDKVFEGICRQFGLIRVHSLEDLLVCADLAAHTGPLRSGRLAVLSNSGGICEIAADKAAALELALPELTAPTAERIRNLIPGFGTPHNPLDLTGAIDPTQCESIIRALGDQGDYGMVLCPYYAVPTAENQISERLTKLHRGIAAGLNGIGLPGLMVSYSSTVVNDLTREIVRRDSIPYRACGLDRALTAIAGIARWSQCLNAGLDFPARSPNANIAPLCPAQPRTEQEALAWLAAHGVSVVPMHLARSADEAAAIAQKTGFPVVAKIASADILHKSDIGGVALDLADRAAVKAAYDRLTKSATIVAPVAAIDGIAIAPMRLNGVELLVGVSLDAQWGPVLAVGLGGIWVEVLKDVSLRLLPVGPDTVRAMLRDLRGAAMLSGQRGMPAADLDSLVHAIVAISDAALAAGPDLRMLEVNPLWVRGEQVEALDALFEWHAPPEFADSRS